MRAVNNNNNNNLICIAPVCAKKTSVALIDLTLDIESDSYKCVIGMRTGDV